MITVRGSKIFNLAVAVTVMFLLAATPVFADAVGKISFLNGRVDILPQGQGVAIPLESGAPVSLKDIIRTKSNSRAEITFNDGTVVRLAQSTRVEVKNYLFDESGARKKGVLNLFRGKIRSIVPEGSKGIDVLTPNAKASATGSDFFFIYEKGSSWFYGEAGELWALRKKETNKILYDRIALLKKSKCVKVSFGMSLSEGISLPESCAFKDIDVEKHKWDTAINQEAAPVVALLPTEGEVYTYVPLGGRAIDTPSLPVPIAAEDLNCTQCVFSIPPEPAAITVEKMGDWERLDPCNPCDPPPPPPIYPEID
jgi:hypothetical protein